MTFESQVSGHMNAYKALLKSARNGTALGVVNEAQTPKGRGGRMPVDTGFLRRSIRAALGTMPNESSGSPAATLISAGLDQDVVIGWTADYAWFQEIRNGFMRGALSNAQSHANSAAVIR